MVNELYLGEVNGISNFTHVLPKLYVNEDRLGLFYPDDLDKIKFEEKNEKKNKKKKNKNPEEEDNAEDDSEDED